MKSHRSFALTLLVALCAWPRIARGADSDTTVDASTNTVGLYLYAGTPWESWLQANYPLKAGLAKAQEQSLDQTAGTKWDGRFVGDIFKDGEPGALLVKFSPSRKTLTRYIVLRWSKGVWKPLLRSSRQGPLDAKGSAFTETDPVDVAEVYLQRRPAALGFIVQDAKSGDDFFGDPIVLDYVPKAQNYIWPDDSDHD